MAAKGKGRLSLPWGVKEVEKGYVSRRREAAEVEESAPLVGLALSGGGIRSATFCLGVLQRLAEKAGKTPTGKDVNLLSLVDYQCTVSGGGYIGSCLSSLTTTLCPDQLQDSRTAAKLREPEATYPWEPPGCEKSSFGTTPREQMPLFDHHQVHHLRKHGDFLIGRQGLYRREVVRAVGTQVVNWAAALIFFFSVLVTMAGAYFLYVLALAGQTPFVGAQDQVWPKWEWPFHSLQPDWKTCGLTLGAGAVFGLIAWVVGFFQVIPFKPDARSGETAEDVAERRRLVLFASAHAVVMFVVGLLRLRLFPGGAPLAGLWLPVAFSLGTLAITGTLHILVCAFWSFHWNRPKRSVFGGIHGICFYFLVGALILVGITLLVSWFSWQEKKQMWKAVSGAVALAANLGLIRLFASPKADSSDTPGLWSAARATAAKVILALAVCAFLALALVVCARGLLQVGEWDLRVMVWSVAGAALFGFILGWLIDFNRISPHFFYRDRLAETYLRTEASGPGGLEIVRDDEHLRIMDLHERCTGGAAEKSAGNSAPYHLILCSLNLAGSRDLARKDRKSDHFIFSKHFCGSRSTGYVKTEEYRGGGTQLCAAMTISGAAVSSAMGFRTSFFTSFAATLFNLRLGYWLLNPRQYGAIYPHHAVPPPAERDMRWRKNQLDELWTFWPGYVFREMFSKTNARTRLVNLSDGGHTGDNLGLYPLLQRRCDVIIACDAECDGDYNCSSLAAAIRQIFVDENVEIDINLDDIRPREKGEPSKKHYAVGRIRYPDCTGDNPDYTGARPKGKAAGPACKHAAEGGGGSGPGYAHARPKEGLLIYLKSSLSGDCDPATVKSYARQHGEFPHEPTADQFFNDAQFEAYRSLGHHIADEIMAQDIVEIDLKGQRAHNLQELAVLCTK